MHLLRRGGEVLKLPEAETDVLHVSGDADPTSLEQLHLNGADTVRVEFSSSSDGRGFSLGTDIRRRLGYEGDLQASGRLNPDQLSLAFQCGFDALVVEDEAWNRYGEDSWRQALDRPSVTTTYPRSRWTPLNSIWDMRHS